MSRNVVMVSIDSLRADHCGFMGCERETTPTIDGLAEEGVVFENAIAPAPSTPGSMSATHTGKFLKPYSDGDDPVIVNRRQNISRHISENETIAERLSGHGYTTIGFSPNPFTSRYFGFDKGFDQYTDFLESDSRPFADTYDRIFQRFISGNTKLTPVRLALNWLEGEEIFKSWEEYYEDILAAVDDASEPYFLWVFLLDTHLPYFVDNSRRTDASWLDMWRYNLRLYRNDPTFSPDELEELVSLYDATIRRVDDFVDRLTDDLRDTDPVYLIHSDHGEAFGEHGNFGHDPYTYEENIHVPYIIANADETGTRSGPTSLRRVAAHASYYAGLDEFDAPGSADGADTLSNPFGVRSAIRTKDWKYIWEPDSDTGQEVYALAEDPEEEQNRLHGQTEAGQYLRRLADHRMEGERERMAISNAVTALEGGSL